MRHQCLELIEALSLWFPAVDSCTQAGQRKDGQRKRSNDEKLWMSPGEVT
jgi:hypothetical protein